MKLPTIEHKELVIHLLLRTIELHNNLKNREARRLDKRYLTARSTLNKLLEDGLDKKLLRPEIRLIQAQVIAVRDTLLNSTIPTYLHRIDKLQQDNTITEVERQMQLAQYTLYVDKNKQRAAMCDDVLKAAEVAL